jgi:ribose 5-phosphate isomerase RpiB
MIYTARQLQLLLKHHGQVTLPYRARLTPLAADWVRAQRLTLGYSDTDSAAHATAAPNPTAPTPASAPGNYLWWCDGPCGTAKAALASLARESPLRPLDHPADARQIAAVAKSVASQVKSNQAAGAILVVQAGAAAMLYANRCPSLRAVLGTCLDAVEQGVRQVAANVLVIEHPYQTLMQMRNMMARFVRAQRGLTDDVKQALAELSTCG